MWHMTYLRDLFERSKQGDVAMRALSAAIAAIDPGLQLSFVFSADAAAALKEGKDLGPDVSPAGLQIRLNEKISQGVGHPCLIAAQLRRIADELDDVAIASVARTVAAATSPPQPAPAPSEAAAEAPAAEAPAALPQQ